MQMNSVNHIELRVTSLDEALPFYEALLPALGYEHTHHGGMWKIFSTSDPFPSGAYFGIAEVPGHIPNDNVIGFWAESPAVVDRITQIVSQTGGRIIDGPRSFPMSDTYYAVFFEDPCGNAFEIAYRLGNQ